MDKFKSDILTDIWALRYVVENLGKIVFVAAGLDSGHAAEMRLNAREKLSNESFPGADPALSDHLADEISTKVETILSGIEENLKEAERLASQL